MMRDGYYVTVAHSLLWSRSGQLIDLRLGLPDTGNPIKTTKGRKKAKNVITSLGTQPDSPPPISTESRYLIV